MPLIAAEPYPFAFEPQAAPAVAQSDGDGALGVLLANDEAVELGNDLAG